jgi:hypothetical protein
LISKVSAPDHSSGVICPSNSGRGDCALIKKERRKSRVKMELFIYLVYYYRRSFCLFVTVESNIKKKPSNRLLEGFLNSFD